ncbi:hypothetical protein [Brevibacillus massiliensis]|uniref:hypothetical protein n=1 Tax=Brevibacillus massiliensis TaxID=1118054 RepID=UPI0002EF4562|nr:hypothetical protein [Brevibacillus massiliensis]
MHDHFGSDKTVVAQTIHERVMRSGRRKLVLEPWCKTLFEQTSEILVALSADGDVMCMNLAGESERDVCSVKLWRCLRR